MSDLIDRRVAIKAIADLPNCYNGYSDTYDKSYIIGVLEELPTIYAVPVRHGRWIEKSTGGEQFYCCSECGYIEWDAPNKYCPNCGARMDEE